MARRRRKRIRKIRKTGQRIAVGASLAVALTAAVNLSASSATPRGGLDAKLWEPIPKMESVSPVKVQSAVYLAEADPDPRTYRDVEFVPLPVPMTEQDQAVVFAICQEYGVAFPLVMAIIEQESRFDRTARSSTGDSGYMQINDCNADSLAALGFSDLYDLEQNVGAGVYMLADLFSRYEGETAFVLMAYNAGEKGAQEMNGRGIFETEYSIGIMARAESFSSYIDDALKQ